MTNPTDLYRLKKEIDAALQPYQASAVSWVTSWSQLVIRKYDYPYSSDRSVIFEAFIVDRADWLKQQPEIERKLTAMCHATSSLGIKPSKQHRGGGIVWQSRTH